MTYIEKDTIRYIEIEDFFSTSSIISSTIYKEKICSYIIKETIEVEVCIFDAFMKTKINDFFKQDFYNISYKDKYDNVINKKYYIDNISKCYNEDSYILKFIEY